RGTQFGPRIKESGPKRTRVFVPDHWNEGIVIENKKIRPSPVNYDGKLRSHAETYSRPQRLRPSFYRPHRCGGPVMGPDSLAQFSPAGQKIGVLHVAQSLPIMFGRCHGPR